MDSNRKVIRDDLRHLSRANSNRVLHEAVSSLEHLKENAPLRLLSTIDYAIYLLSKIMLPNSPLPLDFDDGGEASSSTASNNVPVDRENQFMDILPPQQAVSSSTTESVGSTKELRSVREHSIADADALRRYLDSTLVLDIRRRKTVVFDAEAVISQALHKGLQLPPLKLDNPLAWNFDIFGLELKSNQWPLVHLGMNIFPLFDIYNVLKIDEKTLMNWLIVIEANYHNRNPYHNGTHAADVLQAAAYFMNTEHLRKLFEPRDRISCLIAAAVHDVDHPGRTNAFLVNCRADIAMLYNDRSTLESHHASMAFQLTCGDDMINLFKNIDEGEYRYMRSSIIDQILATEMVRHQEFFEEFENILRTMRESVPIENEMDNDDWIYKAWFSGLFEQNEHVNSTKRILIKCADISNPLRPLHLSIEWTFRITEEFIRQHEEELRLKLPPTLPSFDRQTCSLPNSQAGFRLYFINSLFESWHKLIDIPEVMECAQKCADFWERMDFSGVHSMEELKRYILDNPETVYEHDCSCQ